MRYPVNNFVKSLLDNVYERSYSAYKRMFGMFAPLLIL